MAEELRMKLILWTVSEKYGAYGWYEVRNVNYVMYIIRTWMKGANNMNHIERSKAVELLMKYNKDPFHIQHAYTVEAVMKWLPEEQSSLDGSWINC